MMARRSSAFSRYYSPVLTNGRLFWIKSLARIDSPLRKPTATHTQMQYIDQQHTAQAFTRVFARDLALSVRNVHSLERYRDRRSGSFNSYLTLCAPLHWERRSLYAIDRYLLGTEHEHRTYNTLVLVGTDRLEPRPKPRTTLLSPKGQVWAKLQLRHCTAILHCEYMQPRYFFQLFFHPENWIHEFFRCRLMLANLFGRIFDLWILVSFVFSCRATTNMLRFCSDRMLHKYFSLSNYTNKNIVSF